MEDCISTSASTIRPSGSEAPHSPQSSPRSSALPSPPDSPSSESVSSFPSVSSSFFFSSAAASPPHPGPSDQSRDTTQGLIIPHLSLPAPLRKSTPYGKTIGDLRLIVLGDAKGSIPSLLFDDNEDVVDLSPQWEDRGDTRVLNASTDWIEHTDAHGLEKFESVKNIEIVDVPYYDRSVHCPQIIETVQSLIKNPFMTLSDILDSSRKPSATAVNLLASSSSPLHTALIFFVHSPPSESEQAVLESLGPLIPIIAYVHQHRKLNNSMLSSFRPLSGLALRSGLFRSPDILATLRIEAAHRFVHWYEVERLVDTITSSRTSEAVSVGGMRSDEPSDWSKAQWESDIDLALSRSVALRLRQAQQSQSFQSTQPSDGPGSQCISFDPLHLPSVLLFSLSLVGPARSKVWEATRSLVGPWQIAFLGGFCMGLGLGVLMR